MLPGFNHNIKHNGRIYHVQTEDSGVSNPHIITHLFVGGNILATKKTSYADIVNADNLTVVVRELMEEQHKAMLRNLVNGVYDGLDVPGKPPAVEPQPPAEAPAPPAQAPPAQVPAPASQEPKPVAPKPPPQKFPKPAESPRTVPAMPAHAAPTQPEMPAAGQHVYKPPPPEEIPAPAKPAKPAKPAPKVTIRPPAAKPAPAPAPQAQEPAPPAAQKQKPADELPPEVVAARRMADRPKPKDTTGPTIFGEDLISEKSLDEVILGYLAGDGEEGS
jgi:hypothetical protein